jgi:hypothetical protein
MSSRASQDVRQEKLADFDVMVSPFEDANDDRDAATRVVRLRPRTTGGGLLGSLLMGPVTR